MVSINVESLKAMLARLRPKPADVVGLDIAHSGLKVARVRRNGDGSLSLAGADILPAVTLPRKPEDTPLATATLKLPRNLSGRCAALAVTGDNAVVKLLSFPGKVETIGDQIDAKVIEGIALENPDSYRIGYKLIEETHPRAELRALAVAVPESEARSACMLLATGFPVPTSVELSGLATMTAFLNGPGATEPDDAVGMLEFGESVSFFAIFNRKVPVLIRKFDVGSALILEKVQASLGIDRATADGILADGSFDISQQMGEVMDGFVKQIMVSRDFVERRESCRVGKVYASGGITRSRDWLGEMKSALGYDVLLWNPFACLKVEENALPENLKGQEGRFAAAVGACLATLVGDKA